jgi:hypothetical protein
MSMAVRLKDPKTGEEFSFNPERCVERFYPRMLEAAIQGCLKESWEPWYATYLKDHGITEEVLLQTLRAFSVFVDLSLDPEIKTVRDALQQSCFFDCPQPAQLVVLAKVGQLCAGAFWAGVRHSVMVGVVPEPIQMMKAAAVQLETLISERWNATAQSAQCTASSTQTNGQSAAKTSAGNGP